MTTIPDSPQDAPDPNRSLVLEVGTVTDGAAERRWLITVRGELDAQTAGQLVDAIGDVAGNAVIDLSGVSFMDSEGIRGLLKARKARQERGAELILRDPSPSVGRVLELAGLIDLFTVEGRREQPSAAVIPRQRF